MSDVDPQKLRLYAERDGDGVIHTRYLVCTADGLSLAEAREAADATGSTTATPLQALGPLSYLALRVTFGRYGRPLEPGFDLAAHQVRDHRDDQPLTVRDDQGGAAVLCRFRYKPYGWVYPADYLLWSPPDHDPLAAEAPLISSALLALARARRV